MIRIAQILPGTIAEELQLEVGSRIVRTDGDPVRDTIVHRSVEAESQFEVGIHSAEGGAAMIGEIERDPGALMSVVPMPARGMADRESIGILAWR